MFFGTASFGVSGTGKSIGTVFVEGLECFLGLMGKWYSVPSTTTVENHQGMTTQKVVLRGEYQCSGSSSVLGDRSYERFWKPRNKTADGNGEGRTNKKQIYGKYAHVTSRHVQPTCLVLNTFLSDFVDAGVMAETEKATIEHRLSKIAR